MATKKEIELKKAFTEILQDHIIPQETITKLITATKSIYEKKQQPITSYPSCIDAYNEFILKQTGLPAKFDGAEGKAMKSIITYLQTISHDKSEEGITNSFKHILLLKDRWDPFHQNQLKLTQINSNLINIINSIKNGTAKKAQYDISKYSESR